MKLTVTTPLNVALDADDVRYVRAEDATGSFVILPGHADFLTVLTVSVITWRNSDESEHHIAVRGGTLIARQGKNVEVVTREAVAEDTLGELSDAVLKSWREGKQIEEEARLSASHLQLAAIRQIERYLRAGRPKGFEYSASNLGSRSQSSDGELG